MSIRRQYWCQELNLVGREFVNGWQLCHRTEMCQGTQKSLWPQICLWGNLASRWQICLWVDYLYTSWQIAQRGENFNSEYIICDVTCFLGADICICKEMIVRRVFLLLAVKFFCDDRYLATSWQLCQGGDNFLKERSSRSLEIYRWRENYVLEQTNLSVRRQLCEDSRLSTSWQICKWGENFVYNLPILAVWRQFCQERENLI